MGGKTSNKAAYFDKLKGLLEEYKSIFIVTVDNVSSQQMHKIRKSLRGDGETQGVVLMGKNTMVSHCLYSIHFKWIFEGTSGNISFRRLMTKCRYVEPLKASSTNSLSMSVSFLTSKVLFF